MVVDTEEVAENEDEAVARPGKKPKKAPKGGAPKLSLRDLVGLVGNAHPGTIGQASRAQGLVLRRFSSGIFEVDAVTGGGWPWGRFVRIFGPSSKGKSALVLKSIAAVQGYCRYCRVEFLPDVDTGESRCACPEVCEVCVKRFVKKSLTPEERLGYLVFRQKDGRVTEEILFDFTHFFDDHLCGCVDGEDKPKITERAGPVRTVYLDIENTFTADWSQNLGINNDLVFVVVPSYAEQAIDICGIMVESRQIDVVAIDSIAAMTPTVEIEGSAEDNHMGVAARKINQAFRTWATAINAMGVDSQNKPMVFVINQVREKIGGYGNPETTPGGRGQEFYASIDVRVSATYAQDSKGNAIYADTKFKINKNKTAPSAKNVGSYRFYYKAREGHPVGDTNELEVVLSAALDYNVIVRQKAGVYVYRHFKWKTQKQIAEKLVRDFRLFKEIRTRTLEIVLERTMDRKAPKEIETIVMKPSAPKALPVAEEPAEEVPEPAAEEATDGDAGGVLGEGAEAAGPAPVREEAPAGGGDGKKNRKKVRRARSGKNTW